METVSYFGEHYHVLFHALKSLIMRTLQPRGDDPAPVLWVYRMGKCKQFGFRVSSLGLVVVKMPIFTTTSAPAPRAPSIRVLARARPRWRIASGPEWPNFPELPGSATAAQLCVRVSRSTVLTFRRGGSIFLPGTPGGDRLPAARARPRNEGWGGTIFLPGPPGGDRNAATRALSQQNNFSRF